MTEQATREDEINKLNTALIAYANVLREQGFTFKQLDEDVSDLLCDIDGF